jgi:hypothetical protein
VVTVDKPLPAWGKNKPTFNEATRPLGVGKDVKERQSRVPATLKEAGAKPRLTPPYVPDLKPKAYSEDSQTVRGL